MGLKDKWKSVSKRTKIIIGVVGVMVILLLGSRIMGTGAAAETTEVKQTYIPVNAQTVSTSNISTHITVSGKLIADKEAAVMPKTPGRVASISVKVGDIVTKDQVLFSLDKSDMKSSYDQAAAGFALAQAAYERNKDNYESAKAQLERMRELYEIGGVSKVELEQAEMAASDAVIKTAEAQYAQAKAQYDSVSKTYHDMDVKSPIDGIVTALNVKIGDMATNAAPAATVVDMDNVHVDVSVSEKIINNIQDGQEVIVEIASAGRTVRGKIESLSLAADARTGKYGLKINISNKERAIKPGMFAKVMIDTSTKKDVLVVPSESVIFRSGRNVAYILDGNKAVEKEVTVGLDNGKQVEIINGIEAGDIIIIKGMNFVKDESEIKIIEMDGQPYDHAVNETQTENQEGEQAGGGANQ